MELLPYLFCFYCSIVSINSLSVCSNDSFLYTYIHLPVIREMNIPFTERIMFVANCSKGKELRRHTNVLLVYTIYCILRIRFLFFKIKKNKTDKNAV